jgi:hypothetical protein
MPKPVPGKDGWVEGTVQELLGLEDWEAELIELRLELANAVRERRARCSLTQAQLAARLGSTQPRVAKLEQADASLDATFRAMLALGAKRSDLGRLVGRKRTRAKPRVRATRGAQTPRASGSRRSAH